MFSKYISGNKGITLALNLSFLMVAAAFLAALIFRIAFVFSYIPETGGYSVNVIFGMLRFMNGSPLYVDPQLPPYAINQYMPLQYYIVACVSKLAGIQQNVHAVMVLNKLLCLLFDLSALFVIYRIMRDVFSVQLKKIIWAVMFCSFINLTYHFYNRVDSLYFLNFIIALYFFFRYISGKGNAVRNLILAAVFASLCLFTKQTGLFEIAGFGIYLLFFVRDWKHTGIFAAATAVSILIFTFLFIDLHALTALYQNVVLGVKNGLNHSFFRAILIGFFFKKYPFVIGGLVLAVMSYRKKENPVMKFLGYITVYVFLVATLTSFKSGADINYFTEFMVLTFVMLALYFAKPTELQTRAWFALALAPFFVITFFFSGMCNWGDLGKLKKEKRNFANALSVANYVEAKLQPTDLVFTNFQIENSLNELLYKHSLFPSRDILKHAIYKKHILDFSDFPKRIENGEVKFWIGEAKEIPDTFYNGSFRQNFIPDTVMNGFAIYRYASNK